MLPCVSFPPGSALSPGPEGTTHALYIAVFALRHTHSSVCTVCLVLQDRKYHGDRPVTLVGYSMGARLIFRCLEALVEMGDAGAGIVQDGTGVTLHAGQAVLPTNLR